MPPVCVVHLLADEGNPVHQGVPPFHYGAPVLRKYIRDCIDNAHAYSEQYYRGIEQPPCRYEEIGPCVSLTLDVSLVVAGLFPETHEVECGRQSDENVKDVEHFFRAQDAEQHEEIGKDGEAVRGEADEHAAESPFPAVPDYPGAFGFSLERMYFPEEHDADDRMGQFVRESLEPFLVSADCRYKPQNEISCSTVEEPLVCPYVLACPYEYVRNVHRDQCYAERDENEIDNAGKDSHNIKVYCVKEMQI